ncbi:MAG: SRPBCC family protein [Cyanobacteria bacterium NC_groundwater_1444_Ag_S-0.65um_54_12]|nr:SRPBCC family protein [Cyanobacteria bacterium NC_groundwater_1444_Ag_S-0.65um_54_12]
MLLPIVALLAVLYSPHDMQRLSNGEILTWVKDSTESYCRVTTSGVIVASIERVWALVTDFANYPRLYPGIGRSEVRKRNGDTVWGYFLLNFPWPLPSRWTLNETRLHPEQFSFDWVCQEGTIKRYDGRLQLQNLGNNRTLLEFEAVMDPGFNFIPAWLVTHVHKFVLPAIITNVREYLATGADVAASEIVR